MQRFLMTLIVSALSLGILSAQTCTETLQTAQRNFDDGLLEEIPSLIADCMQEGFTREEKANAFKLLIQTYIYNEDILSADETMLEFLNDFPSYPISSSDPKEFVELYNTYDTDPIFQIEVRGGFVMSMPVITENHSTRSLLTDPEEYYMGPGFLGEVNINKDIRGNFSLSGGVSFLYASMGYWSEPYDFTVLEGTLYDTFLGLPLSVIYDHLIIPKLAIQGIVGVEPALLLKHKMDFIRTDNKREQPYTDNPILTSNHHLLDIRPFIRAGAKLNIGRDFIAASVGFKTGTISTLKEESVYADDDFPDKNLYLEDQRLNNHFSFSISYIRPVYNPQKRTAQ